MAMTDYPQRSNANDTASVTTAPAHCPTCHSQDVTTASKVVDAATYWRCGACGDVWNVGRRLDASRYSHVRGFGR